MKILLLTDEFRNDQDNVVRQTLDYYVEDMKELASNTKVTIDEDHPGRAFYKQICADAVIVDYGGMGLGQSGFIDAITRHFAEAIKTYPSTDFFLISQMYEYEVRDEINNWLQSEGITEFPGNYHVGWDSFEEWYNATLLGAK